MRRNWIIVVLLLSVLVLLAAAPGLAANLRQAAPARLTYQGNLLDASGNPVADGTYTMAFSLWNAASGGARLWGPEEQEVTTEDGFFAVVLGATVPLDPASLAAPLYLEIAVEGQTLTPRQELASVAFALVASQAEAAPWSGLSGIPAGFADGVDDVDDTVSWSEISGIVGTGANQVAVGNHAHTGVYAPVSHTHDDRYYTETELGTSGSASVHWGNLTNIPAGFADGVDDTGQAAFGPGVPPANNTIVDLASMGLGVGYASATIGADGLPIIAYYDITNGDLKVAHCNDVACTSATHSTLDSTGNVGRYMSIALGVDGLPVIAYYDVTNGDLKVAHCDNVNCTNASLATLDSTGDVGQYTSVTINRLGAQGWPIIAYYDATNGDLKVAQCNNVNCTNAALSTVDWTGNVGQYTSIALGADGLPIIAYYDVTNGDLKVAHCSNGGCFSSTYYIIDSTGNVGQYSSLVVGVDGLGLIAYRDVTNLATKVAHCNNVTCSSATISLISSMPTDDCYYISTAVGQDGLPVISCVLDDAHALRFVHCNNWSCSGAIWNTISSSWIMRLGGTSITIGVDGVPLVVGHYTLGSSAVVCAVHCANPFCSPYFGRR